MTERIDYQAGDRILPVIPYDTFEAANLFMQTGRTPEEVLERVGLSHAEWEKLRNVYRWFPTSFGEQDRQDYFNRLPDADICRLVLPPRRQLKEGEEPQLRSTWHIRESVRRKPFIGPFADCDWPYAFIATHAEANSCCYTHDGRTVYFDGKPLTNRNGEHIDVDAASFKALGGRWLCDRHHVYGQGLHGAQQAFYWYLVEGADTATFEALNLRYARDRGQAYYITGKTIRTKSPDAFEIVPELRLNYRDGTRDPLHSVSVIARDREAVYFYGARLKKARPEGFHVLGHGYATDGTNVWFLDEKKLIEGADAASFTVPSLGEPHVWHHPSGHGVTDRYRPYVDGEPCDPHAVVEIWRPFFDARPDLQDWWWHRLACP